MTPVGQPERATQNRVVDLFGAELGYRYLGDWSDGEDNSNVEDDILTAWLRRRGHTDTQIARALDQLGRAARNPNRSLYDNNKAVYRPAGSCSARGTVQAGASGTELRVAREDLW